MLPLLIYLIFVISVATAAGGVIISSKIRNRYPGEVFSSLLYYQIFIFTFGFYGIWGQVLINYLLSGSVSPELLSRISEIGLLLGFPFLIFAGLMLVRFSAGLAGRKTSIKFTIVFLIFCFSLLLSTGYFITRIEGGLPVWLLKSYFVLITTAVSVTASILILRRGKQPVILHDHDRRVTAGFMVIISLIQSGIVLVFRDQTYIAILFILIFFAGNTFLPVYIKYGARLSTGEVPVTDLSFDDFCRRFEISPREKDIVREICNGLSNQEISDKLFISLQTVKDHTHRIYIKTNVRSRMQLMKLVKGE